ncbi:MAG: hypothetical protein WD096_05870 [Actinomycetota bacterium]
MPGSIAAARSRPDVLRGRRKYAIDNGYPAFNFLGPMSTTTGNTPTQAWNQMVDKMDARPATINDMSNSFRIEFR